jgi:hypothetical protein
MPESRRFDREPETDIDTRFFDLRESGYTGWIDQDGYPVHDQAAWEAEHAPSWCRPPADTNTTDADEL